MKELVSIIIVNYNGKNHLEKCLESIMRIDYNNYEIILVDNNSTDKSIELVKNTYPNVMIIKLDKNYGFAEPNNIGAKNAKGDFLFFLNNDTIVTPKCISELINVFKSNAKIAICQSLLLKPDNNVDSSGDFIDDLGRAYRSRTVPKEPKKILSARGAAMMVRKKIFWELNGFDENFFVSFEDVDIGWRAWIWGYEVLTVPSSIVFHSGGTTVKQFDSEIKFHGIKNNMILRFTNFEGRQAFYSLTMFFFLNFIRKFFGKSLVKDVEVMEIMPTFKTIFQSLFWLAKNHKYLRNKKKSVNNNRVLSTDELLEMGLITKH